MSMKTDSDDIMSTHSELDKYYTKEKVANACTKKLMAYLKSLGKDPKKVVIIEPSAGSGVFLKFITTKKIGFDILPTESEFDIIQLDFLNDDITSHLPKGKEVIFLGNPPFGLKSKLAIDFINKALEYSKVVAFILPIQFRKWSVQSKINKDAKLVKDYIIPDNSFEFVGKDYNVRCCFQIWTLNDVSRNLRLKDKPPTTHPDFELYQFNRTEEAKKYFDYDWDFAVPRQGYYDYTFKAYKKEDCDLKKQWIFIKAKNKDALKKLMGIDFDKLSKKNIGTPGFGKADLVEEYKKLSKKKTINDY